jgi:hypothetical protein
MRDGRRWLQPYPDARRLIRRVFVAFLLTFIAARMLVIGIMARRLPDLFLHLGGTHVHHLDYGRIADVIRELVRPDTAQSAVGAKKGSA